MEAPDANMLVFIDEAAVDQCTSIRWYGWSCIGQRCSVWQPFVCGLRYSILPAITLDGIIVYDIIEGPIDGERFLQFLRDQVVCTISFSLRWHALMHCIDAFHHSVPWPA